MVEIWKVWKNTTYRKDGRRCANGGLWEVSNYGNIKKNGVIYTNISEDITGHLYFGSHWWLHRVVGQLFVYNENPKLYNVIDHIDGNPRNNHYTNLRWTTQSGNMNNPITKERKSIAAKGFHKCNIWINNGIEMKFIQYEELDKYLNNGWTRGQGGLRNNSYHWYIDKQTNKRIYY